MFSTFPLRQLFTTIPQSLSDAARIDGANEFYIYRRIVLPLAKPALMRSGLALPGDAAAPPKPGAQPS